MLLLESVFGQVLSSMFLWNEEYRIICVPLIRVSAVTRVKGNYLLPEDYKEDLAFPVCQEKQPLHLEDNASKCAEPF